MAERYPGDGAARNGFGRRHLHEDEARLLFEAEYPTPPDMRAPGAWRLSAGGVPVPPVPTGAERRAEIARIRSSLSEEHRRQPRYAPDSATLWTAYFERRREEQLASTNGGPALGRNNSEGRRLWWGVPGRTLEAVLEHIEGGNEPRLGYPEATSISRRRGSSWQPRRMEAASSSSSHSSHSSHSSGATRTPPVAVKAEPGVLSPLRRSGRSSGGITINEGRRREPSPPRGHLRLVRPKTEPGTPAVVKQEHLDMATADDEAALKWARDDYVREEVERQRRALEEIEARHRARREEEIAGLIILDDDSDGEAPGPSNPDLHRFGDAGQGCSRDGGRGAPDGDGSDGDGDDGGDYTDFYKLLGM